MIEVGVGVENVADGESELVHFMQNSFGRSTGINDDRLLRHWISDDRTVTPEGWDGKCFSNHGRHDRCMLPSKPIGAQAAGSSSGRLSGNHLQPPALYAFLIPDLLVNPLLALPEPEWSK